MIGWTGIKNSFRVNLIATVNQNQSQFICPRGPASFSLKLTKDNLWAQMAHYIINAIHMCWKITKNMPNLFNIIEI